jgi:hypothetical protein
VSDIFDEVEEELRAERAKKLLQRYGSLIIGAAVAIVALVAGFQAWRWYEARERARVAEIYIAAMHQADAQASADHQAALAGLAKVTGEGMPGYTTLARLRAAALKANAGDKDGALRLWDDVAKDASADPLLRDLANLEWGMHQIDTGDPAQVTARLKPLTDPNNAWHAMAEEQLALLALRQGQTQTAHDALKKLANDVTAPQGVRGRAGGLLAKLGG